MAEQRKVEALPGIGGVGESSAADSEEAGRSAVLAALDGRTPAAGDLVVIFPSVSYDLDALHHGALAAAGPAHVVGATTVGAFTHETQVPSGCAAIHMSSEDASFGVCHVELDDADAGGVTRRAAEAARDRAGERYEHSVLMVMCDGLTPDQREIARGAFEVTSALIPLVGGVAGDDLHWKQTHTFGEGRRLDNGLVCVWINSSRQLGVAVDHGWRPFGKPMLVTRSEGAVLHELDGEPAADVYLAERGLPVNENGRSDAEKYLVRPLGLPNVSGSHDLRQILTHLPDGGLVLTTGTAGRPWSASWPATRTRSSRELGEQPNPRSRCTRALPAWSSSSPAARERNSWAIASPRKWRSSRLRWVACRRPVSTPWANSPASPDRPASTTPAWLCSCCERDGGH